MKEVFLKGISLIDWRGQRSSMNFVSLHSEIRGRNRSGKSSIMNAFLWLFTGYDEYDRANYRLFDETIEQTYDNAAPAAVDAWLDIDGVEHAFRKIARQGWARKRGNVEYERTGTDKYNFFIDGIEVSATQYRETVEMLFAPIDKLKIMLNLRYFLSLDWKEMRKQLECMVGTISVSDFKGDYSSILPDLDKHTAEELKASYKAKMKPIKTSIDSLPITIETLRSNLPDLSEVDEAEKNIHAAKERIADIDSRLVGMSDFAKPYRDKRNAELAEINKLQEEYRKSECIYRDNFIDELAKIEKEMREVDSYNADVDKENKKSGSDKENAKKELEKMTDLLAGLQKRHEELTEQNKECKARVFSEGKCSYCGQELPFDKLEEARRKFNEQKEKDHANIVAQGKLNRAGIARVSEIIGRLKTELEEPLKLQEKKSKDEIESRLNALKLSFIPYEETAEGKAKAALIEEKKAVLTVIPEHDCSELLAMKNSLMAEIEVAAMKLGLRDEYEKQTAKIKELQESLRDNSNKLAELEGKLAKVKEYEEEKARIVSDKVNKRMEYVSIEMSETNKSGDIVPACIVKDEKGVNALVTNNASRVKCEIDIAMAFQNFYDISLPVFIDNFELFDDKNWIKTDRQIIKLIVDDCPLNVI